MPLCLFYTMVQKSQKWPKTQIKGVPDFSSVFSQTDGGVDAETFLPDFLNKLNFTFASFENFSAIMHVKSKRSFNLQNEQNVPIFLSKPIILFMAQAKKNIRKNEIILLRSFKV